MNYVKTFILLFTLTLLLIWVGSMFGGPRGAMIAFIFALVLNLGSYWFSDKIILTMYKAKEVSKNEAPELYSIVEDLIIDAKLPMPKVCIVAQKVPNAFATGRDPNHAAVCVTEGILGLLTEDELKGVLAHELAHIKNRDTLIMTIAATVAGAIMMLASMARWAAIFGGFGGRDRNRGGSVFGLIAIAIFAPLAAMIVQLAISRTREYAADKRGAHFAHSAQGLASALKKLDSAAKKHRMPASPQTAHLFIVNPLRGDFLATLFSTHPPVEKRVERLESLKI
ncbi:MAG: zinc metalloprotease HtpX [Candidatus Omnitrophica bacterium]|nr:zinc metalloprotease HtpX [Candidatus Omnitrophota bacterium]